MSSKLIALEQKAKYGLYAYSWRVRPIWKLYTKKIIKK